MRFFATMGFSLCLRNQKTCPKDFLVLGSESARTHNFPKIFPTRYIIETVAQRHFEF